MIKARIMVSDNLNKIYFESLKSTLSNFKSYNQKHNIEFELKTYHFSENDIISIKNNSNDFLDAKYQQLFEKNINSIIFVPDTSINLKGNFLWYSSGEPKKSVMVFSSYLFKKLIERQLVLGDYLLLLYSQYLARYTVKLNKSHRKSRNCLNDFCPNQIEILNVFKIENRILCDECYNNIIRDDYFSIIESIMNFLNKHYYKGKIKYADERKIKESKKIVETKKEEEFKELKSIISKEDLTEIISGEDLTGIILKEDLIGIIPKQSFLKLLSKIYKITTKETWYEFEIYMAKKCANMSELYEKLNEILEKHNSTIEGYSLYEVGGGYKQKISLNRPDITKWKQLITIKKDLENKGVNDIVRPLINYRNKKFVIYDETSIILKIVAKEKSKITRWEESTSEVLREIREIFEKIKEIENSVFFTIKELDYVDSF